MATLTVEVTIPEELTARFEARINAHRGDTTRYVQEVILHDLSTMQDAERQQLIGDLFQKIDQKYGEALKNLAG